MQSSLFQKKTFLLITFAIATFFLLRLLVIYFGSPRFFCESELFRGTMAREIMSNPAWPLLTYQGELHTGGTFIASLMIIPFFAVFGENLVAIKMLGLIVTFLMILSVYYFTYHCVKKPKVALMALFWLVFATPIYLVYSTVFIGEHYESQLLSFWAMILFYSMTGSAVPDKKKYLLSLAFGLVCGFSIYFSYTFLITFLTCLCVWFLLDRFFFLRKHFFVFALGAMIGFVPRILFNRLIHVSGLHVRDGSILTHIKLHAGAVVERLSFLVTTYWPHGLWLGDIGDVEHFPYMGVFLGVLFIVSYSYTLKKYGKAVFHREQLVRRRAMFLVLIYPAVFLVLHSVNDYNDEFMRNFIRDSRFIDDYSEFKYVFSIFPYLFIVISEFLTSRSLWGRNRHLISRLIPIGLCLFFWFSSLANVLTFVDPANYTRHVNRWRPYSYHLMGEQVVRTFFKSGIDKQIDYVEKIKRPYRNYAYLGFGYVIDEEANNSELVKTALSHVGRESRKQFVRGLGVACGEHLMEIDHQYLLEADCPTYVHIPDDLKENYIEGIGLASGLSREEIEVEIFDSDDLPAYFRAYAVGKLRLDRGDFHGTMRSVEEIAPAYRKEYEAGLLKWKDYFIDFEVDEEKLRGLLSGR